MRWPQQNLAKSMSGCALVLVQGLFLSRQNDDQSDEKRAFAYTSLRRALNMSVVYGCKLVRRRTINKEINNRGDGAA